jgi:predicted Rossmann fold nucleotide-binding protein DprA/Smf involved in DNA uptake
MRAPPQERSAAAVAAARLDKPREMLLDALGFEPVDVDTLVNNTGSPAQTVSSMLLIREGKGRGALRAGRQRRGAAACERRAT